MNYPTDPYEAGHSQGERTGRNAALRSMSHPVGNMSAWCDLYDEGTFTADEAMAHVKATVAEMRRLMFPSHPTPDDQGDTCKSE